MGTEGELLREEIAGLSREAVELSREEVERHLLSRQTISDLHTPVSLTLPNQLFSDNLMDGSVLDDLASLF